MEDVTKKTGQASDKTHERIEQAAGRVKQRTSEATQGAKATADAAAEKIGQRVDHATDAGAADAHRAADKAAQWRQRGSAGMDNVRDRAGNLYDTACRLVREKPMESVAVALAAGWLIGRLMRGRR